jgi:hypothetical protein
MNVGSAARGGEPPLQNLASARNRKQKTKAVRHRLEQEILDIMLAPRHESSAH